MFISDHFQYSFFAIILLVATLKDSEVIEEQSISAINRFLMNRVGDRGFKIVARYWMRDQKRKEDGLRFLKWVYQPGIIRKSLWPIVKMGMLARYIAMATPLQAKWRLISLALNPKTS